MENVRQSVCDLRLKHTLVVQQDNDTKHTKQWTTDWIKKNIEGFEAANSKSGLKSGSVVVAYL